MTAMPKSHAEAEKAVTRSEETQFECPTVGCENMVTHINLGVCNDCWDSAFVIFRAKMNWPIENK